MATPPATPAAMEPEALAHSTAVYLYAHDPDSGAYAQQTDSVVGCALLVHGPADVRVLFYEAKTKAPVAQVPVRPTTRFTPQENHYVNYFDPVQQRHYAMRFKDDGTLRAFLRAVAFAKAQAFVHERSGSSASASTGAWHAHFDDLDLGKKDSSSAGVGPGDVVGLAWTLWQGPTTDLGGFFRGNPVEIPTREAPAETVTRDGELKRVALGDPTGDVLSLALAEGLVGMHKHGRRLVTIVLPATAQWLVADVELVKVRKAKKASVSGAPAAASSEPEPRRAAAAATTHDELVHRMAMLSRAGSQGSGLIASLNARNSMAASPPKPALEVVTEQRRPSALDAEFVHRAIATPGMVPVPLPGIASSPEATSATPSRRQTAQINHDPTAIGVSAQLPTRESLVSRVISPLKTQQSPTPEAPAPAGRSVQPALSTEMERLLKEQSELDQLRKQLEESKRKLQQDDQATSSPGTTPSSITALTLSTSASPAVSPPTQQASAFDGVGVNGYQPWKPPSTSSLTTPLPSYSAAPAPPVPSIPSLRPMDTLPSFTSSGFSMPSSLSPPPVPSALSSSMASYGNRSLVPTFPSTSGASSLSSPELENYILRLQRSSTSIESTLQDLQSKMDRLLNMQSTMKTSKYSSGSSAGVYNSSLTSGLSVGSSPSSSSSSSMLLKNLEKALAQRDQLQDANSRLQDAKEQLESAVEDLQGQHESLQLENRNLLDKLQSGNHLQQEKFRLELRNVQQQLSHTQEQMLVYQEENFRLRQELAAKDEQVVKEKAHLQDDARKQLEQLQRQVQMQIQQESEDAMERLQNDKIRLEKQLTEANSQRSNLEVERDGLANQLRYLQTQQSQWKDEQAQSLASQDARVRDLQAQLQQAAAELSSMGQQVDKCQRESRQVQELLTRKDEEMAELQQAKTKQEYAALSELLKEFMNDIYFHFQDAFEEDAEFTGKEIVGAIRKILKQNTMEILAKLEEFWQMQHAGANK